MAIEDNEEVLIPDAKLRDAYCYVSNHVGEYREKFCAETKNVELVRQECGPEFSHIRLDWIRKRIATCCKNPSKHGGGWAVSGRGHGPTRKVADRKSISEYEKRLRARPEWPGLRDACFAAADYRCQLCNDTTGLQAHHRTYDTWRTPEELSDLTCLCRKCHERFHFPPPGGWESLNGGGK